MLLGEIMNIVDEVRGRPWNRRFAWRPHCCYYTNELIWLKWAYTGASEYIINTPRVWITKQQHLMMCLTK